MCGRYAASRTTEALAAAFHARPVTDGEPMAPDHNVAPTKPIPSVLVREPREPGSRPSRELRGVRWGLVPSWAREPSAGARLFNARVETAAERPAFASSFRSRRCLLPADGWYEWTPDGAGRRWPWFIHPKDAAPLAFAGLYAVWRAPGRDHEDPSAWLWSATVLTTAAVPDLVHIHDRMPVVVPPSHVEAWLDPTLRDPGHARSLLAPPPAGWLVAEPVSVAVGDVRANGPGLVRPVAPHPAEDADATLF